MSEDREHMHATDESAACAPERRYRLTFFWGAYLLMSAGWLLVAVSSPLKGWDFAQFYIAGHLPAQQTYDRAAALAFAESHLRSEQVRYVPPYVRPAAFAYPLAAFAGLPYQTAFWLWAGLAVAAYTATLALLVRYLRFPIELLPACGFFFPAQFGTLTGQDITVWLLSLTAACLAIKHSPRAWGGWLLSLCLYKFNLMLLAPIALLRDRRNSLWEFVAGGAVLAALSVYAAPVESYVEMLRRIPEYSTGMEYRGLHGLTRQLELPLAFYFAAASAVVAACVMLIRRLSAEDGICVGVIGSLMVSWHAMWYDAAVLLLPIAVLWPRVPGAARTVLVFLLIAPPAGPFWSPAFHLCGEAFLLFWFYRVSIEERQRRRRIETRYGSPVVCGT